MQVPVEDRRGLPADGNRAIASTTDCYPECDIAQHQYSCTVLHQTCVYKLSLVLLDAIQCNVIVSATLEAEKKERQERKVHAVRQHDGGLCNQKQPETLEAELYTQLR